MTHSSRWNRRIVAAVALALSAGAVAARAQAPAATASPAAKRPMTFLGRPEDALARRIVCESGRSLAPVHGEHARLEGRQASDRHLPRLVAAGPAVDEADDVHEGQERDRAAVVARWPLLRLRLEPRDAPSSSATQNQLYAMRPDGGEARKITEAKEGVTTFAFSHDGKWLAYRAGKSGEEQLYRLSVEGPRRGDAGGVDETIGRHRTMGMGT